MTAYLDRSHLDAIFSYIAERYSRIEEVPDYALEKTGVDKLCGVFEHS
jgi:hypothetical protein